MLLISGFRRSVNEMRSAIFWCFTQRRLAVLPTFRDNLPVTTSRVKQSNLEDGTVLGNAAISLPRNHYSTLRKIPKSADFETKKRTHYRTLVVT
jgi:hypothetical protein